MSIHANRLLVVDDNEMNRDMLSRRLMRRGFQVATSIDGEAALAAIRAEEFDLILLDIMMPGIDGIEVLRRVRETYSQTDLPIIMATAKDESKDIVEALKLGANDYVTKPLDFPVVLARVTNALERKQAVEDLRAANQRMRRDLKAAARVQRSLLPDQAPETDGLEFAWIYRPCEELAGDSLNIFRIDDHHVAMYVLDVSGHGVPSALLSVSVTHHLTQLFGQPARAAPCATDSEGNSGVVSPAWLAQRLNTLFPMDSKAHLYFTFLCAVLDTRAMRMCFVSAGNPGPAVVHTDGSAEIHDVPAVPIGMFPESEYQDTMVQLQPGDRVYLHSDGIYEEKKADNGEIFGRERMTEILVESRDQPLDQSIRTLLASVTGWSGTEQFTDDTAILACAITGNK